MVGDSSAQFLGVGEPAVVVDREMDPVPADPAVTIDLDPRDAVTATWSDPAEHLGVEVHELTRPLAFVADDRWPRFEPIEAAETLAAQPGVHRRAGQAGLPGEDVRTDPELAPSGTQARDELGRVGPGLAMNRA